MRRQHSSQRVRRFILFCFAFYGTSRNHVDAFLAPSKGTNIKNGMPPTPPEQLKDVISGTSIMLNDLSTSLGTLSSVLTGMGAGIGAWTALSAPLQKPKSSWQPWQNVAASLALLGAGASTEAAALPLFFGASAAGLLATQQRTVEDEDDDTLKKSKASFAWSRKQESTRATKEIPPESEKIEDETIHVEDELGLLQNQAANLVQDVSAAVDRLSVQANMVSSYGGVRGYNGPSPYSTGYAAGSRPLYFSPGPRYELASQKPSEDAVSDFVTNLDAAVTSLQDFTPEPYLDGEVEPQYDTSSWDGTDITGQQSGYFSSYLDELSDGGVMAIPSYPVPSENRRVSFEAPPEVLSVPEAQASYAPTKPGVKGVSSVSLAQAGSYLEQLKDAVTILPSFVDDLGQSGFESAAPTQPNGAVNGLSSFSNPEVSPVQSATLEKVEDEIVVAPKMSTVPGKQSFRFSVDSFAPTKKSVKGLSSASLSQASNYLEQLKGAAAAISSFVDMEAEPPINTSSPARTSPQVQAPAPKMSTIPLGNQKFSQKSFAPTKPSVKGISSTSVSQAGSYLSNLKDAVETISSFQGSGSTLPPEESRPNTNEQQEVMAPKMSTMPPKKQVFQQGSFAPTHSSVKNVNSVSISSYVDSLGDAVDGLATFVDDVFAVTAVDPPAPKMTTVPLGNIKYSQGSFAPTKSGVKGISYSTLSQAGGYLDTLKQAVRGLSSFSQATAVVPSDGLSNESRASKSNSMAKLVGDLKNTTSQLSGYSDEFDGLSNHVAAVDTAVDGMESFVNEVRRALVDPSDAVSANTTTQTEYSAFSTMPKASSSSMSFAPTKPEVKNFGSKSIVQAGGYLDQLKDAMGGLSSFEGLSSPVDTQELVVPKFSTLPIGNQAFRQSSFAPTKSGVKNVTSHSLSSYLSSLNDATNGLSSFVESVRQGTAFYSMPTAIPFAPGSFAPTKSTVKNVSSASVSQAGGYLTQLKTAVASWQSIAETAEETRASDDAAVAAKMTTVPLGKKTFKQSSFAPTKANVKNVPAQSLSVYLNSLSGAVTGLSSFVELVGESIQEGSAPSPHTANVAFEAIQEHPTTDSRTPSVVSPFSSMPQASSFAPGEFATTKSSIKSTSSKSLIQAGGYLNDLKIAVSGPSSPADPNVAKIYGGSEKEPPAVVSQIPNIVSPFSSMPQASSFAPGEFATTKPSIKSTSVSLAQAGGYLGTLKDSDARSSLAPNTVGESTEEHPIAVSQRQIAGSPFSSMPRASSFAPGEFATTKSSIKSASESLAHAGGYLGTLKDKDARSSLVPNTVGESTQEHITAVSQRQSVGCPFSSMPRASSFAPGEFATTKSSIKSASSESLAQAGGYLGTLKDSTSGVASLADPNNAKTYGEPEPPTTVSQIPNNASPFSSMPQASSFAPGAFATTKSSIKSTQSKSLIQAGGYLDTLKDAVSGLLSLADSNVPKSVGESRQEHSTTASRTPNIVSSFSSMPQASSFAPGAFAPTKSDVKTVSSISFSKYLESLDHAVSGLSTFVRAVDKVTSFSSMPKSSDFAPGSFAPTKAGVKGILSVSVAQAGGYLDTLRSVRSAFVESTCSETEPKPYPVAPMSTVPTGKAIFKETSFAPTKSSVKDVVPAALPSYLNDLQEAVSGLSSFVEEVAEYAGATADIVAEKMTTIPAKSVFQKNAFAPTKSSVGVVRDRPQGTQGNYLEALNDGFKLLGDRIQSATTEVKSPPVQDTRPKEEPAPKMTTIPAKLENLPPGGYAPTKPSIKSQSAAQATQAGGYLDSLKNAVTSLSSFVDAVNSPAESTPAQDMPVEQLKSSVDRLTPFLDRSPVPISTENISQDSSAVTQPVLDSAVANLNQKLSSLSLVVSELSDSSNQRSERLESKVDDLSDTVRALNQSVSNLASCIQALNDGFSGLMAVAETLQQTTINKAVAP